MEQRISIERMEQAVNLFGSFDENVRLIESEFKVTISNREGELRVNGEPPRFEIIDELTVRYSWDDPNPGFLSQLASPGPPKLLLPASNSVAPSAKRCRLP